MATTSGGEKRRLPPKIKKMQARKRRKLFDEEQDASASLEPTAQELGPAKPEQLVRVENLAWKPVDAPDNLEDYEGFFGLEEIDDVEVVRDAASRKVSFKVVKPQKFAPPPVSEDILKVSQGSGKAKDEWQGFDDDESQKSADSAVIDSKPRKPQAQINEKTDRESRTPSKPKDKGKKRQQKSAGGDSASQSNRSVFDILAEDDAEENADISAWRSLQLSEEVYSSLSKLKFDHPTAIQASAIPHIADEHDVIGKAPTGSGKTLAFGIPIVEKWLSLKREKSKTNAPSTHVPIALIILPTRELAHQIKDHLAALCSQLGLDEMSIATLTGGLSIQKQQRQLEKADIVIGTPGRLWEVASHGHGILSSLKQIRFLVVDEADRLLTEGHFKELEELLTALDREVVDENADGVELGSSAKARAPSSQRQTLVFSATFSKDLQQKLAKRTHHTSSGGKSGSAASMEYLLRKLNFRETQPRFIDVNPQSQMATNLQEGMLECPVGTDKDLYLYTLLLLQLQRHHQPKNQTVLRTLVFVNSISAVRRLVPLLQNLSINALALHSQMPQKARLRSLERFTQPPSAGSSTVLIATDVAARGLDIPAVNLVVHYHVPRAADTYIHRSGRTARAQHSGASVLICAPEEAQGVRRLVARVHASNKRALRKNEGLRSVELDARVLTRVRRRVVLAKKLADAAGAKEKKGKEDSWMARAAEELGVDLDEVDVMSGKAHGRGKGRKKREEEARGMTKAEMKGIRGELTSLLSQKLNVGVSERYLTSGGIDVAALLSGNEEDSSFLGHVQGFSLD